MSATMLRDAVRTNTQRLIDQYTEIMVQQHTAPLDHLRLNQGKISGLLMAAEILDQAYRDLHS